MATFTFRLDISEQGAPFLNAMQSQNIRIAIINPQPYYI